MSHITSEQFNTLFPKAKDPSNWVDAINNTCTAHNINTPKRLAAFLAQCGHESGGWTVFQENLNYSAQGLCVTFKKYFPTLESAQPYARQPQKIANRVYANRMGNGPEPSNDGWLYRGRGPIQLTGRSNYTQFAKDMCDNWENVVANPDQVATDRKIAIMSAIWFWNNNKLNTFADNGDFVTLTKRINGGTNGLADRQHHYEEALNLLM